MFLPFFKFLCYNCYNNITKKEKEISEMANCVTLNQTSYHGAGAIQNIPAEVHRWIRQRSSVLS